MGLKTKRLNYIIWFCFYTKNILNYHKRIPLEFQETGYQCFRNGVFSCSYGKDLSQWSYVILKSVKVHPYSQI